MTIIERNILEGSAEQKDPVSRSPCMMRSWWARLLSRFLPPWISSRGASKRWDLNGRGAFTDNDHKMITRWSQDDHKMITRWSQIRDHFRAFAPLAHALRSNAKTYLLDLCLISAFSVPCLAFLDWGFGAHTAHNMDGTNACTPKA